MHTVFPPFLGSMLAALSAGDWIDVGCAAVALLSIGVGAHRGLSSQLPLGVGWCGGVLAAWYAYAPLHALFREWNFLRQEPETVVVLTLIVVVLLAWGVSWGLTGFLRWLVVQVEKRPADYALGTIFGLLRAFVLLLLVTTFMLGQTFWQRGRAVFCEQSHTGKVFAPLAAQLLDAVGKLNPHFEIRRRQDPGDLGAAFDSPAPRK
jgi:uncharacterized membrane protein required for colicin V production